MKKHPMQKVVIGKDGVARFQANGIVRFLLEYGYGGIDMNRIATMGFSDEDRMQFAQLIGYSVSGYGSLDYVTKRSRNTADRRAQKIRTSMKVREK